MARGRGGKRRGNGRSGFGQIAIGEELKIALHLALKNFSVSEAETELQLPSSLLSTERAYVHKVKFTTTHFVPIVFLFSTACIGNGIPVQIKRKRPG